MPNPLDQTYLIPAPAQDVAQWIRANRPGFPCHTTEVDGVFAISDGTMNLLETVASVTGGTVVSIAPRLGDAHEMASFLDESEGAARLIAYEEAANTVLEAVEGVGGIETFRIKGKWRPADPSLRPLWAAHATAANNAAMRLRKAA